MTQLSAPAENEKITPLCPVFGTCGGCAYQDLPYEREVQLKEANLRALLTEKLGLRSEVFRAIVPSPSPYHYRNRLDLTVRRYQNGAFRFGFQPAAGRSIVGIEACAIARREISDFIPELTELSRARLPENYRTANLVVRTGDDGRVAWGGIGRRSLRMEPADYFWTEIRGRKIYYSLETFFQANLAILPQVMDAVEALAELDAKTIFYDLYSGVGLFAVALADAVRNAVLIEEAPSSVAIARHNVAANGLENMDVREGKMEKEIGPALASAGPGRKVAIVDPPRRGLSPDVAETLAGQKIFEKFLYLSCHPESLARDLAMFLAKGWRVEKVVPFDFFPRTAHLETLVLLRPA